MVYNPSRKHCSTTNKDPDPRTFGTLLNWVYHLAISHDGFQPKVHFLTNIPDGLRLSRTLVVYAKHRNSSAGACLSPQEEERLLSVTQA